MSSISRALLADLLERLHIFDPEPHEVLRIEVDGHITVVRSRGGYQQETRALLPKDTILIQAETGLETGPFLFKIAVGSVPNPYVFEGSFLAPTNESTANILPTTDKK